MSKLPIFEWFWSHGDVLITVNTKMPGVDVPPFLRDKEIVDFILGRQSTPRMQTDEKGILVGMRFSGTPYTCFFPWDSVSRMDCQASVIQFRPQSAAPQASAPAAAEPTPDKDPSPDKDNRPKLRLVK